jgi:hypothetical protein
LDFIPFACPNCGWELAFRPHTTIHFCKSCARAWEERGGEYVPVPYRVVFKENLPGMTFKYLPFWHLTVNIATPEKTYHTAKDFYELFPVPKVWDPNVLKDKTISFYIPAFKIRNAALVDRFSSQLTKAQPTFAEHDPESIEELDLSDVWLSLNEAKEMAHVLMYSLTWEHHRKTKDVVKNASLQFPEATLLCLPFRDKGIYLREAETDFALQKNALDLD